MLAGIAKRKEKEGHCYNRKRRERQGGSLQRPRVKTCIDLGKDGSRFRC